MVNRYTKRLQIAWGLTSLFEWIGVIGLFLAIGWVVGINVSYIDVLVILVVANVVGVISFIPGGLGSFDLVAIAGLSTLGLSHAVIVSWILLFRIAYYIFPFIVSLLLMLRYAGESFNTKNDGIPKKYIHALFQDFIGIAFYVLGVFFILSATIPEKIESIRWLATFGPTHANLIYHFHASSLDLA